MAVDMFLKLEGIKGEAQDKTHKDEIDVLAWSWGVSNSGSSHMGRGGGSGKANFQDISVTKYIDIGSTALMNACATGTHIKSGLLTVRKAGGKSAVEYLKITLTDCLVSSVSTGGSGGEDRLTENLSINFAEVKVEYTAQNPDGSTAGQVGFSYDIKKNESK